MAQQPPAPPPPPAYGQSGPGARPPGATAPGVILIVLGVLYALIGILVVVGGGAAADIFGGGIAGAAIAIGLVVIAFGVLDIISGIKVIGGSGGWRIGGIVLTAIGSVFALIGTIGSFSGQDELTFDPDTFEATVTSGGPNLAGIIVGLLFLAANVIALILLARLGRSATA